MVLNQGTDPPPHHEHISHPFLPSVAAQFPPIYERMADPNLLRRPAKGKTKNANECLHAVIWSKCSKNVFVGKQRIIAAVASVVSTFSMGATQLTEVMNRLGAEACHITSQILEGMGNDRIEGARRHMKPDFVTRRRIHVGEARRCEAQQVRGEGCTYGAREL